VTFLFPLFSVANLNALSIATPHSLAKENQLNSRRLFLNMKASQGNVIQLFGSHKS
jgi:hypothetical protein